MTAAEPKRFAFAHRGGSHGPENRLQTFVDALARGADGLETDAWVTADGAVVLDHDGVVGPPGSRRQPIAEVGREQLPAHIPTLDELYQTAGTDFALAIDVKSPVIAAAIAAVAARFGAAERLWVVAPHSAHLEAVDLGAAQRAVTVRGEVMRSWRRRVVLPQMKAAGVEAINARWMWWTRSMVAEVHDLGLRAFGYDAQRRVSLQRCFRIGLDGVFSDHVERMLAARSRAMAGGQPM
jgi:glycerophosphoryl diester phosphodiesterase